MKLILKGLAVVAAATLVSGCAHIPGTCNLKQAADDAGLINVTTGDGTFANYNATGYHTGTEIGIAVGIPGLKLMELYPTQSDTAQMTQIAKDAKAAGADAVINAHPPKSFYTGFPLVFLGRYIDSVDGTGIKTK